MKKRYIPSFLLIFSLMSSSCLCLAGPPPRHFFPDHGKIKERLVTLRNWKLMEEFNLSGDRANRVFNILKTFDDRREDLILKRKRLYRDLRNELQKNNPSDEQLRNLMDEITRLNVELSGLSGQEVKALEPVFSLRERAQYLLFSERFAREARRLLMRPRPAEPGVRNRNRP